MDPWTIHRITDSDPDLDPALFFVSVVDPDPVGSENVCRIRIQEKSFLIHNTSFRQWFFKMPTKNKFLFYIVLPMKIPIATKALTGVGL
jgi:hypothetical protein